MGDFLARCEFSCPDEGWQLLVSLMAWRDKRTAAKRPGFFSRLTGRGRA